MTLESRFESEENSAEQTSRNRPRQGETNAVPPISEDKLDTSAVNSANESGAANVSGQSVTPAAGENRTGQRSQLYFDPEPTQRMVVVRRRKRRRSKKVERSDVIMGRFRTVVFGIVVLLLLVALIGQDFAAGVASTVKDMLRPIKGMIGAPRIEVVVLVVIVLIMLYLTPGVESAVKRWLGFDRKDSSRSRSGSRHSSSR